MHMAPRPTNANKSEPAKQTQTYLKLFQQSEMLEYVYSVENYNIIVLYNRPFYSVQTLPEAVIHGYYV